MAKEMGERNMFNMSAYLSSIQKILELHEAGQRLLPLVPREPLDGEGLALLGRNSAEDLFSAKEVVSLEDAECVRSALYLYFSDLDASHRISQGIPSSTGSFLHGVMHRQKPDFSNSKYWFRQVGGHDVFPVLRAAALEVLSDVPDAAGTGLLGEIERREKWDPFWFVDECQAVYEGAGGDLEHKLMEIQRLEWQLLFDYCYRRAVGTG